MPTKKFAKEEMIDLANGEHDEAKFKIMENELVDTSRWSLIYDLVFKEVSTGKYYETAYSTGATESQDERPYEFDDDEIVCQEVYPREVSTIEWTRV